MKILKATLLVLVSAIVLGLAGVTEASAWETYDFSAVRVAGGAAFLVTDGDGEEASVRASHITAKVNEILTKPELKPQDIKAALRPDGSYAVVLGDYVIALPSQRDAQVFGSTQEHLARKWAESLREKASSMEPIFREGGKFDVKMLGEHQVLLLLLQIAILLTAAFICGQIVVSFGQPAVIGQMLAGIILGKSVFGTVFPDFAGLIFPVSTNQNNLLEVVSWFGVIFLLMLTGLETDVELIKAQGKSALGASVLGILVPFSAGFGFAYLIPADILLNPGHRLIVALFLGTVFAVSSVPVIAKILMDMKLLRRNVAQVILATALVHDTVGCIILALVAALASAHSTVGPELLKAPVGTAAFLTVAFLGRKYFFNLLRWINDRTEKDDALVTAVTVLLLLSAAFTQFVGVHVVLGAFICGFLLSQTPIVGKRVIHSFEVITMGIFAPIFFAAAGLHVNLQLLADPMLFFLTIGMTLVACASKVGANFVGGRWGGLSKWEALCLGFGANAPGAMGLIVGILGYSMGIITVELLSIIIVMSLLTTAITPPLMKWALKHVTIGDAEQERLDKEEAKATTHLSNITRVLVPTGGGTYAPISAHILRALGTDHMLEATALTVFKEGEEKDIEAKVEAMMPNMTEIATTQKVTMIRRQARGDDRAARILEEARLGYQLILMGATRASESSPSVFGEVVDAVVADSPCPVFVIRRPDKDEGKPIKKILIPTIGSETSLKSTELGLVIARDNSAHVTFLSVVESVRDPSRTVKFLTEDIAESTYKLGRAFEVEIETLVREAETATGAILSVAKEIGADAIILGGERRPTKQLYLGQIVRTVMQQADCIVGVYVL
ncbi:MAG: cation:proton antiporter [Candidatus Obscuribacterales bacterium]